MSEHVIHIVGGGLAGSEAAWQAANLGCKVLLFEMRPLRMTPAHHTDALAELVCSNSFRGASLENAVGLLKEEMRRLNSVIMRAADRTAVPAGGALAVDREAFSAEVGRLLANHPGIEIVRKEVTEIPDEGIWILATGPLTSEPLAQSIIRFTGEECLSYYDAAAPLVNVESIDRSIAFRASRYNKGQDDAYWNCPLDKRQYEEFWQALVEAEQHAAKEFEKREYFEGCLPVEEMARRGKDTLRFGPMKPVGLIDPRTGKKPYAVVQLRQDNREGTLFNMVGFQTSLKWGEQQKIFRMIPGLEEAEFERYGVIHRNTFIKSPRILLPTLQTRKRSDLFFAGQITGVEGYIESAASGLVAGLNAARIAMGAAPLEFPRETAIGSLCHYITTANPETFQPKNISFGLLPPGPADIRDKRERKRRVSESALRSLKRFIMENLQKTAGVSGTR